MPVVVKNWSRQLEWSFVVWGFYDRSEEQLELDAAKMEQTLRALWVTGSPVTFSRICPPDSTDRITALETFELLLSK
jgi:hypothetical protein